MKGGITALQALHPDCLNLIRAVLLAACQAFALSHAIFVSFYTHYDAGAPIYVHLCPMHKLDALSARR